MKVWCLIGVVCLWMSCVEAANNGGCIVKTEDGVEIADSDWDSNHNVMRPMADNSVAGTVVYTFDVEGVNDVSPGVPTQPSDLPYVTFVLRGNQLIVEVTSNIFLYEKDEVNTGDIITPVIFFCDGGPSNIVFNVPVTFSNNYDPVFAENTEDAILLPMPYPADLLVTTITVTDIDMDTKEVIFTLDAAGQEMFSVMPQTPVNGKIFKYDLMARSELQLDGLTQTVATVTTTQNGVSLSAVATLSFLPAKVM